MSWSCLAVITEKQELISQRVLVCTVYYNMTEFMFRHVENICIYWIFTHVSMSASFHYLNEPEPELPHAL